MTNALERSSVLGWNLAFSAGATAAGLALVSPRFAASLALGALLETVSFRALWRASERVLLGRGSGGAAALGAFGVRFVMLAAVLWVALGAGAHPVGLVVGLSLMVPAVVLAAWRVRPRSGPAGPAPAPDDPSWDAWNAWLARERPPDEEVD
jgi:hypothetical protein